MSRTEFDQFSAVILDSDQVFYGLGWTPIIDHAQRLETEIKLKQEGFPDFHVTEFSSYLSISTQQKGVWIRFIS